MRSKTGIDGLKKNRNKVKAMLRLAVTAVLVAMLMCALCSCGESVAKTKIASVTVAKGKNDDTYATLTVEAMISDTFRASHKGESIYLFEIPAYMSAASETTLDDLAPIAEKKLRSGNIKFSVELKDESDASVVSSYLIAHKGDDSSYIPLTTGVYVSDPESLSDDADKKSDENDDEDATNTYIKGFDLSSVGELCELKKLGADCVLVEADIAKLFASAPSAELSDGDMTDDYMTETETGTVYFNKENLCSLEGTVKALKTSGIKVYLRLALKSAPEDAVDGVACMYYTPSADEESGDTYEAADGTVRESPEGYAINICTARSADMLFALFSRLARAELCECLIIGDALNDTGAFGTSYAFEVNEEDYAKNCAALVRMAYICARRVSSDSKIYVSLGNSWEDTENDGGISSRRFISLFDTFAEAGGDFRWNVALRAELGLLENESVTDAAARELASRYVPLTDLSDIVRFLSSNTYKYAAAEERSIIVDGAEITSAYDGSEARQNVAAAYALAYIKAIDSGIDAVIYSGDVFTNRYFYNTLLYIDTPDACHEGGTLSFISDRLGTEFSTLYTKYNGSEFQKSYTVGKLFSFDNEKKKNEFSVICDFEDASEGILTVLHPSMSVEICDTATHEPTNADISEGTHNTLSALINISTEVTNGHGGIRLSPISPRLLSGREAMSFVLETDTGASECKLVLALSQGDLRYIAEAYIVDGVYGSVSFDISEFSTSMRRKGDISAELYVLPVTDSESSEALKVYLDEVYTVDEKGLFEGNVAFAITVAVLVLILAVLIVEIVRQAARRSRYKRDGYDTGRR